MALRIVISWSAWSRCNRRHSQTRRLMRSRRRCSEMSRLDDYVRANHAYLSDIYQTDFIATKPKYSGCRQDAQNKIGGKLPRMMREMPRYPAWPARSPMSSGTVRRGGGNTMYPVCAAMGLKHRNATEVEFDETVSKKNGPHWPIASLSTVGCTHPQGRRTTDEPLARFFVQKTKPRE